MQRYGAQPRMGSNSTTEPEEHRMYMKNRFRSTGENELKLSRSSDENELKMNKNTFLIQEEERLVQCLLR